MQAPPKIFRIKTAVAVATMRRINEFSYTVANADGAYLGTITMTEANRWMPSHRAISYPNSYANITGAVQFLQRQQ